jgi:hypothetical protein
MSRSTTSSSSARGSEAQGQPPDEPRQEQGIDEVGQTEEQVPAPRLQRADLTRPPGVTQRRDELEREFLVDHQIVIDAALAEIILSKGGKYGSEYCRDMKPDMGSSGSAG